MPALDRYDPQILDDNEYDELSQTERRAAEEEMRRRDKEAGVFRRDDREIFYDASDEEVKKNNSYVLQYKLSTFCLIGSEEKTSCCRKSSGR